MKKQTLVIALAILLCGCTPETDEPVSFSFSPESVEFGIDGGEKKVEVSCNYGWDAEITGPGADYFDYTTDKSPDRAGKTVVTITAGQNLTETPRTALMEFRSEDNALHTVTVSQEAASFHVQPAQLRFDAEGATRNITVTTNIGEWGVESAKPAESSWLEASKSADGKRLILKVEPNTGTGARKADLNITAFGRTVVTLSVQQAKTVVYYADKDVVQLQKATVGGGINIVFMGDGYLASDMAVEDGKYEKDMRRGTEYFFSVYPFSRYRDHFNVWMVVAVSAEAGVSVGTSTSNITTKVNTKFGTLWWGGTSTHLDCTYGTVQSYTQLARAAAGNVAEGNVITIIPVNADIYAGTCHMYNSGYAIALCGGSSRSFGTMLVHESCGHAFAQLHDEYINNNYANIAIPAEEKTKIQGYKDRGFRANVDFSGDITKTSWAAFANYPKYSMVKTYEGALWQFGIWRPEEISCMLDNRLYFNAPSRWAQVKRIHELAGIPYTFEQFVAEDDIGTGTRSAVVYADPTPLSPPVVVEE